MSVRSIVVVVTCIVFVFFDGLCDLGVHRHYLEVVHESAVLEHGASAFEVAALDGNDVAADAAGWLEHVQV